MGSRTGQCILLLVALVSVPCLGQADEIQDLQRAIEQEQRAYRETVARQSQAGQAQARLEGEVRTAQAAVDVKEKEMKRALRRFESAQEHARVEPSFSSESARQAYARARDAHEQVRRSLTEKHARLTAAQNKVASIEAALAGREREIKTLERQLAGARFERLRRELSQPTTVTVREEMGCGELTVPACQQQALERARRSAIERGSAILVDSVTIVEDLQLTRDEIRARVRGVLTKEEVLERGWVGDSSYFYKIRGEVRGQVPAEWGSGGVAPVTESVRLDRAARIGVQRGLASLGYAPGPADGQFGPVTRAAVRRWQAAKGFAATGVVTEEQAAVLRAQGQAAVAERLPPARLPRARDLWGGRAQGQAAVAERLPRAHDYVPKMFVPDVFGGVVAERPPPRELRNSLGLEFVLIEPGTFEMGSPAGEAGREDGETLHRVTLRHPYYLGKYEVTQGQFDRFVAATGYATGNRCWTYESGEWEQRSGRHWRAPGYQQSGAGPVVCVSWEDAQAYATWVSRETGEAYRLPTEAEWEYAARGGRKSRGYIYAGSDTLNAVGWYRDNSGYRTHPVGQKGPNELGLYDMSGNVWEWVQDWYGDYPRGSVTDPRGPSSGAYRVGRGGGWLNGARKCRVADRSGGPPSGRYRNLGFRLARTP